MTAVQDIDPQAIEPSPFQTRSFAQKPDADLISLAASIRAKGVIQPIVVREHPDKPGLYQLAAGERRLRATRLAEQPTVPAIVRVLSDDELLDITVIENLQRKDLSPIEEADGVSILVDRGRAVESIAKEIGHTDAWVAGRLAIGRGLSERWSKLVRDPETPQGRLGFGTLHLVARLSHEGQDQLLEVQYLWREGNSESWTLSELRNVINREVLHTLSSAPWKKDDADLVPAAGPCSTCPKRSSCQPLLWEEDAGVGKKKRPDHCTDVVCWNTKLAAHVKRTVAVMREEYGDELVLLSEEHRSNMRPSGVGYVHGFQDVSKSDAGAVPVVYVDGRRVGQTGWVKEYSSSLGGAAPKKSGPKPLAERRKGLRRLRLKIAIASAFQEIEAVEDLERLPSLEDMAVLVAVLGTRHRWDNASTWYPPLSVGGAGYGPYDSNESIGSDQPSDLERYGLSAKSIETARKVAKKEDGSGPFALFDAYNNPGPASDQLPYPLAPVQWVLWKAILPILGRRLIYRSDSPIEQQWTEVSRLAGLVGVDVGPHWQRGEQEKPEPKSWAKLNADGTPKKAPATKTGKKTAAAAPAKAKAKAKAKKPRRQAAAKG